MRKNALNQKVSLPFTEETCNMSCRCNEKLWNNHAAYCLSTGDRIGKKNDEKMEIENL